MKIGWKITKLWPFSYFQMWYFHWYQIAAMLEVSFVVLPQRMMQLPYKKNKIEIKFSRPTDPLPKWRLKSETILFFLDLNKKSCPWAVNYYPLFGPRQANMVLIALVLIAYASSEGSGEPAHPRSLARTFAARSYKQWVKRNLQTESQIPSPSEWLGMRS